MHQSLVSKERAKNIVPSEMAIEENTEELLKKEKIAANNNNNNNDVYHETVVQKKKISSLRRLTPQVKTYERIM